MTMRELVLSKLDTIALEVERRSGIGGLTYQFVERQQGKNKEWCYYLLAYVPATMLGVMANNLKAVEIEIVITPIEDGKLFYTAKFQYQHKDGGSNGMSVMTEDGREPVRGWV